MVDRRPRLSNDDLARRLHDLGGALEYPDTPDSVFPVRERIATGPRRVRPLRPPIRWQRVLACTLIALILLGALLGAFPSTRRAIAGRLGLRNVALIVTAVPIPTATVPPSALPTPAASVTPLPASGTSSALERQLGTPATLTAAQSQVNFLVQVPTASGYRTPDAVFVGTPPPGGRIALVYRSRPDRPAIPDTDIAVLLTEFRGGLDAGLVTTGLPSAAGIEAVPVRDAPGYWIAGGIRLFLYKDASGAVVQDTIRTAGNTLLWERNGVVYRMETTLSRDDALRIAASIP